MGRTACRLRLATVAVTTVCLGAAVLATPGPAAADASTHTAPSPAAVLAGLNAGPPVDEADPVYRWTYYLQDVFRRSTAGPTVMSRGAAMMYLAVYDAVDVIFVFADPYMTIGLPPRPPECFDGTPDVPKCLRAAVTAAAATVLRAVFPESATLIDAARAVEEQRDGTGPEVGAGRAVGQATAQAILNAFDTTSPSTPYVPDGVPGAWRPTGNGCTTPLGANWGSVVSFDDLGPGPLPFAPPPPGGFATYQQLLASPLYAQQVNEVKALGRATGSTRTAEQTQIAFFWSNDLPGTYHPPGQHLDHTRIFADQWGLDLPQNARLFALVSFAMAEAGIVSWHTKFQRAIDLWRPESAITLADTDGNPATTPDPTWQPLSVMPDGRRFSPCFPAYISGHATFAGAWAAIMTRFFRTTGAFTGTTDDPNASGVTRTFPSFAAAAREDARSRVYLGVHYQFDADFGLSTGDAVGNYIFDNYLRDLRTAPTETVEPTTPTPGPRTGTTGSASPSVPSSSSTRYLTAQ